MEHEDVELPMAQNEPAALRGAARRMIIDARENAMEATALCVADRAARSPPQALVFFGSIAAMRRSNRVNGRP